MSTKPHFDNFFGAFFRLQITRKMVETDENCEIPTLGESCALAQKAVVTFESVLVVAPFTYYSSTHAPTSLNVRNFAVIVVIAHRNELNKSHSLEPNRIRKSKSWLVML